jgi:hypothetical protein
MSSAPSTDAKETSHYRWTDTIPPDQIEARTHPMPSLHDQDEVDHVIHSTFWDMGTRAMPTPTPRTTPKARGHLSACALAAAAIAGGYAFGSALVALSNL